MGEDNIEVRVVRVEERQKGLNRRVEIIEEVLPQITNGLNNVNTKIDANTKQLSDIEDSVKEKKSDIKFWIAIAGPLITGAVFWILSKIIT